jgi:serine phosphatase RsbU (regulator of sigma subunit)
MINTASNYMPEGPRMAEFFVDMEGIRFLHHYLYRPTFVASGYGQALFYAVFAATFLNVKKYAPWLYKLTIAYIVYVIAHYLLTNFVQHHIPQLYLWLPNGIFTFVILFSFFGVAFARYRAGQNDSGFLLIAIIPYLVFRTIYVLGLAGIPSPFTLMEPKGLGLLLQDSNVAQAIGICSEALIMALAVIGRTRWLQTQLARNIQAQKTLVENQNRLLEETVQTRTQELQVRTDELAQQHEALDKAHRLVVSSVDYASRLQRGQLPKPHRLQGRFASFDVIWLPRDTIGGDLWWLGATDDTDRFNLAVADCTGHGVPGAMLSLLVSHSLDRIYSHQPMSSPAQVLLNLDHMVRVALNQDSEFSESDDGCDAIVLNVDRRLLNITYAAAKIDLLQVSSRQGVIRHPSVRTSLGYKEALSSSSTPKDTTIAYESGDVFVVVTDGFTDQVGGKSARPSSFGYKRLQAQLQACVGWDAKRITAHLQIALAEWRSSESQRDDITVVVFEL